MTKKQTTPDDSYSFRAIDMTSNWTALQSALAASNEAERQVTQAIEAKIRECLAAGIPLERIVLVNVPGTTARHIEVDGERIATFDVRYVVDGDVKP